MPPREAQGKNGWIKPIYDRLVLKRGKRSEKNGVSLDGIPGVVPGLVAGFQGWKCPGALAQPCCELKSLKFILSDSNFLCPPALNTLVTLGIYPSVNQEFFFR
jgi:hypothetical protein